MSLRNLLGLGRKLVQKKADDAVPEAIETTTIGGLPDLTKLKTPIPNLPTVAEQSRALVAKEPKIQAPFLLRPMDNMKTTAVSLGNDLKVNKIYEVGTNED